MESKEKEKVKRMLFIQRITCKIFESTIDCECIRKMTVHDIFLGILIDMDSIENEMELLHVVRFRRLETTCYGLIKR
jgi:hypothetical protein